MIYTIDNTVRIGRPVVVYVDGVRVPNCFYADTAAGFVRFHVEPVRANRRRTAARWAKKRGVVRVYDLPALHDVESASQR